jgi:hypothetical protein
MKLEKRYVATYYWLSKKWSWQGYFYRHDPVPGIHSYKASNRSCFRSGINCMNEKRQWYKAEDALKEYGVAIKRRRAPRSLPSDYDDIGYSHGYRSSSWKNCTKKRRQWGGSTEFIYCG